MSRLARLVLPAALAFAAACSNDSNAETADSGKGGAAAAGAPAALATPMDTAPLRAGEIELTGLVFRMPAGHMLRTTGGGADYRLYAISPSADSTTSLIEFYLGDRPQFDVSSTRQQMINGLVARDRVAKLPEDRWSREMLLELPRTAESGQPTRVHLFYNRQPKPVADRADSLIASMRCCIRAQAPATKTGG